MVYPELGVFDPARRGFTDFIQSFRVTLGGEQPGDAPLTAALATLPLRLRQTFGERVARVPWIYLNRRPRSGDGAGGELSAQAMRSPQFDLHDPAHRDALVDAVKLLKSLGFERVHLDLEPFPAEDVDAMIGLLDRLREATGPGFMRSVFTPKYVRPQRREVHPGFVWMSTSPFQRLAAHCEQLVIPLYDYGPLGREVDAYQARVSEVAADLLPSLEPADRVWFGLPAYRLTAQHSPAETIGNARAALAARRRLPAGFAVFTYTGEDVDYVPGSLDPAR